MINSTFKTPFGKSPIFCSSSVHKTASISFVPRKLFTRVNSTGHYENGALGYPSFHDLIEEKNFQHMISVFLNCRI